MDEGTLCSRCGAPYTAGLVACSFCSTPYAHAAAAAPRGGVDCPSCHADNTPERYACARCGTSLLRECIFCRGGTTVAAAACAHCNELFEGAEQRKLEREAARQREEMMRLAATGMSVLGQVAQSPAGQGLLSSLVRELGDEFRKG